MYTLSGLLGDHDMVNPVMVCVRLMAVLYPLMGM